jgi:hypothetical protein
MKVMSLESTQSQANITIARRRNDFSRRVNRFLAVFAALSLACVAAAGQFMLKSRRERTSPAVAEGAFAALGAFRSMAAEVIWFRADRLQDEGRYVELQQLASLLTFMEPHTSEVWSFAAWNLAYNVSIMMPTHEDRWRWVYAGLKLLRDEGLRINPKDAVIYRELAWMFQLKIGANLDLAADTYRQKWKEIVEDVDKRNAWSEIAMDREKMAQIEKLTGFSDWRESTLSAIYWASEGLKFAEEESDRRFLENIIRQSLAMYKKRMDSKTLR